MSYRARVLTEVAVILAIATFLVAVVLALPNPATFPHHDGWKPCTVAHLRAVWGPVNYQDHYWVTLDGRRVGRAETHPYCTPDNTP